MTAVLGGELFDLLEARYDGYVPAVEAVRWLMRIASAIEHCHYNGAVHGQLLGNTWYPEMFRVLTHETAS